MEKGALGSQRRPYNPYFTYNHILTSIFLEVLFISTIFFPSAHSRCLLNVKYHFSLLNKYREVFFGVLQILIHLIFHEHPLDTVSFYEETEALKMFLSKMSQELVVANNE